MGPGSGFDVLDALKTIWPGEKMAVVVSAASEKAMHAVAGLNVYATLRKPFDVAELLRLVRESSSTEGSGRGTACLLHHPS